MQEEMVFLTIVLISAVITLLLAEVENGDKIKELETESEKLTWYRDTAIKQLSNYPLIKLVVGTGIENIVICRRLNGFASIEVGDIHYDANNQGYLITHFIGIIENDIYFNSIPFKNDNSYLL